MNTHKREKSLDAYYTRMQCMVLDVKQQQMTNKSKEL